MQGQAGKETIVFEGDQAADPANNVQLREMLEHGPSGTASASQKAWIGSAVAIKEPTCGEHSVGMREAICWWSGRGKSRHWACWQTR